eukprot:TRINITY_DN7342_c0_g1_i1.p1 TRINITY_DN7342_c0_g1~~TRINITY_DN7342_c0_g1_i1.p1  ORF type:complete len:510 (-),score=65.90 TRINITY_DN7342_c0_g1_i1:148-1677(-)
MMWLKKECHAESITKLHRAAEDYLLADIPQKYLEDISEIAIPKNIAVDFLKPIEYTSLPLCTGKSDFMIHVAKAGDADPFLATPNVQRESYGVPDGFSPIGNPDKNRQMVWGPCTYGYLPSDLKLFYQQFSVNATLDDVTTYGYKGIAGGDNFVEGSLDTQYISSIAAGVHTIVANTNNTPSTEETVGFGDAFLNFTSLIANMPSADLPNVISLSLGSLSWGSIELMCTQVKEISNGKYSFEDCLDYLHTQRQVAMYTSAKQMQKISVELLKIGLRGVTVLAAAGDGGAHFSFVPFNSSDAIGELLNHISCNYSLPTFPAASPYVVAVGGTQWDGKDIQAPVHWPSGGSGFSWQFLQPKFQYAAVESYLQTIPAQDLPPLGHYRANGRAYPDVSAVGNNVPIVIEGRTVVAGGTSCSTPEFAGLISLINDRRIAKGLPTLGPLNTRIYKLANDHPGDAFYDITSGNSDCAANGFCCGETWFAGQAGWDPVTGLGSPLFGGLLKYLSEDA